MLQQTSTGQRRAGAAARTATRGSDSATGAQRTSSVTARGTAAVLAVEAMAIRALRPVSLTMLRVMLGVTFIWFGALKVLGVSPVEALVARTLPFLDPAVLFPVLGAAEVGLGAALVAGVLLRLVLPVLVGHLAGTFLTFVMAHDLVFTGANPLLLTADGEFVMKNLVLISAAVVLLTHLGRPAMVRIPTQRPAAS